VHLPAPWTTTRRSGSPRPALRRILHALFENAGTMPVLGCIAEFKMERHWMVAHSSILDPGRLQSIRTRNTDQNIVAFAPEERMISSETVEVKIARPRAVRSRVPFPGPPHADGACCAPGGMRTSTVSGVRNTSYAWQVGTDCQAAPRCLRSAGTWRD